MKIKTKRFDKDLPLPAYEDLAAGFDFVCRSDDEILPGKMKAISGNIAMVIPDGYVLLVVPRSSTPSRFDLVMSHSVGVIDPFYHGDTNEIKLLFQNIGEEPVSIKRGDQIAQGMLLKCEKVEFDEVESLEDSKIREWKDPGKIKR